MGCIKNCWDQKDQTGIYSCPQCRQTFTPRPDLHRNTILAEVVEKLKETGLRQLQEKICSTHDKLLEVYCRTDEKCVCYACVMDEHRGHDTVSAAAGRTEKQKQLGATQTQTQQRLQEREKELQELRQAVESLRSSAHTAVQDTDRIFTELIRSIERTRSEVTQLIRAQERAAVSQAEGLLERLEKEIAELKRRDAELDQLSHTENHIHFLQNSQSVYISQSDGVELDCDRQEPVVMFVFYSPVAVTLDPDTAHCELSLSEDGKRVRLGEEEQDLSDNPHRFDYWRCVVSREAFTSGRHYWEVEVNNSWRIGVTRESADRKGGISFSPQQGYWCLYSYQSGFSALTAPVTPLPLSLRPRKLGVCVDIEERKVSFYTVESRAHVYTFTDMVFTQEEKIYPVFCTGDSDKDLELLPAVTPSLLLLSVQFLLVRKMAEGSISVSQDQFSCSVCLDLLKDPVTLLCGHSYCMGCIKNCWDQEDQTGIYSCPNCRQTFTPRPDLHRNTILAEVVEKLKETGCSSPPPAHRQLQEKICSTHDKLCEVYCHTDEKCVCYLCVMDEHRGHDTVSAAAGRTEKQKQLGATQTQTQQRLQEREKELQELRQAVESLRVATVTLDPDTAHCRLSLSEDGKRVRLGERKSLSDNPHRFDLWPCVVSREAFTSGRHYWEVEVNDLWRIGVTRESAERKGGFIFSPQHGYWCLKSYWSDFSALTDPRTRLPLSLRPRKLGLCVDIEEREVSFYTVESRAHLYTFTDMVFTQGEKIYPVFCTEDSDKGLELLPAVSVEIKPVTDS
ncbi:TRI39 ligase, partial [Atractosteus spatula]|nr:TRI39 ligase [Atractosteus spatula]